MSILLPVAQSSIFFWIRSCSLHDKLLPLHLCFVKCFLVSFWRGYKYNPCFFLPLPAFFIRSMSTLSDKDNP